MKKRRPCTWNQSRSPRKNSPKPPHVRPSQTFPAKAKSVYDLKHRRSERGRLKHQQKCREQGNGSLVKRDAFGSLESLFDVKKSLTIPELYSLSAECYTEGNFVSTPEAGSPRDQINILQNLLVQTFSPSCTQEPHILQRVRVIEDFYPNDKFTETSVQNSNIQEVEALDLHEILSNTSQMADENEEVKIKTEPPDEDDAADEPMDSFKTEDETEEAESPVKEEPEEEGELWEGEEWDEEKEDDEGEEKKDLEDTDVAGEGEAVPATDTIVLNEMQAADQKCQAIAQEIEQLRSELAELGNKKDLTQEEKITMQEKHEDLMVKVAEFEEITQKIQQLLGLTVPISCSFTKMFEGLPCIGASAADEEEDLDEEEWRRAKEKYKEATDEDRFDLPSAKYPEDNLPRVIVCGYTEDDIPKIVVADGDRRGKKSRLDNLTGRLTESLTMQEKLAKENAQLEGGKYRLEEALLEKDSALESLQRKVCGLQAEMRIVVKENMELTRQVACLSQRMTASSCAYTCPGGSPSTAATSTPFPYDEGYCRCKCCMQPVADTSPSNPAIAYGSPRSPDSCRAVNYAGSPRLAGGASREGVCCSIAASSTKSAEMCCRNPAVATKLTRNTCIPESENRFSAYGNTTRQLEQQLGSMENEVRNMQMELANVQRERQQLEQQRKLLKCTGPCAPCSCCPAPSSFSAQPQGFPQFPTPMALPLSPVPKMSHNQQSPQACSGPCANAPMGTSTCPQQQLRDLREQYARLQEDYKNKLVEVSCLRSDAEKLKQESRNAREEKEKMEIKMIDAQERLKTFENDKNSFEGNKEQLVEQEQALLVAKQRFREAQDEIEELRSLVQDQAVQLEDYRNKYLQAQEHVEEQRRQMDLMEMDNARMNENVTLEIGRVKNQFQEKLAELAPLPDILKQCQVKLQESQQLRLVAERNCEDLSRELMGCKDKLQTLQSQLDVLHNERMAYQEGKGTGAEQEELELRLRELKHENERMKNTLARFEEHEAQLQKRIDEKNHEITQLAAMLEQVREDSARQVARTKERCETIRKTMQGQIAEMERQLAQCRATARAAQKDRDEIRQKMQGQINNLNEAFEQAQGRIRSLQGHVNYLKTSYTNIFKGQGEVPIGTLAGEGGTGYDSCDCNY